MKGDELFFRSIGSDSPIPQRLLNSVKSGPENGPEIPVILAGEPDKSSINSPGIAPGKLKSSLIESPSCNLSIPPIVNLQFPAVIENEPTKKAHGRIYWDRDPIFNLGFSFEYYLPGDGEGCVRKPTRRAINSWCQFFDCGTRSSKMGSLSQKLKGLLKNGPQCQKAREKLRNFRFRRIYWFGLLE